MSRVPVQQQHPRAAATQAVSEDAHCWEASARWSDYLIEASEGATPIHLVTSVRHIDPPSHAAALWHDAPQAAVESGGVREAHGAAAAAWAGVVKFKAKSGEVLVVPGADGGVASVLLGTGDVPVPDLFAFAALPTKLPPGTFALKLPSPAPAASDANTTAKAGAQIALDAPAERALLGWALGCYSFDRYKSDKSPKEGVKPGDTPASDKPPRVQAKLVWPEGADRSGQATALAAGYYWARDLINTPAEDLGPGHLAAEARAMAQAHGASINVLVGEELLDNNYPAIHTVGRAADRPPLLIDINWQATAAAALAAPGPSAATVATSASAVAAEEGPAGLPLLSLVGKGVCFDSGGLDIKPASGMKMMKKDMGGAALVLALAHVVMSVRLPVRLRVLVPAVENAISGNAYRPLDVLRTRAGITVENGNTDAEGRLILCDALYEATRAVPDLLIDAATLTGAARAALGPDMPATFTNDDATWSGLEAAAGVEAEGLWRLPLYAPYKKMLESSVADISSTGGDGAQGGAILAALYLQRFVKDAPRWVHLDTPAWTVGSASCPGRPEGAEANGLRALWRFLRTRYA